MEQDKRKKRIIIALVILAIIAIILGIWWLTKSGSATKGTKTTKTGVDLGQLDPNNRLNPDGTPIGSGSYGNENGSNNGDGTDVNGNKYSTIGNGLNGNGTNGSGNGSGGNGSGSGSGGNGSGSDLNGGNGNGTGGAGDNLVDITGNNTNNNGNLNSNPAGDPCAKAFADLTPAEKVTCIGNPGNATIVEDNVLIFKYDKTTGKDQRDELTELDRSFYRTAPALANPDIVADYQDEIKDYVDKHVEIRKDITLCLDIIDDEGPLTSSVLGTNIYDGWQRYAAVNGIDGRTWYRGNVKNGYTPGSASTFGNPAWRAKVLPQNPYDSPGNPPYDASGNLLNPYGISGNLKDPAGNHPHIPAPYYYLRYFGEYSLCKNCGNVNGFGRRGGDMVNGNEIRNHFRTELEKTFNPKVPGWFDRGTFLNTSMPNNNGDPKDPVGLRQFEELFEIY